MQSGNCAAPPDELVLFDGAITIDVPAKCKRDIRRHTHATVTRPQKDLVRSERRARPLRGVAR